MINSDVAVERIRKNPMGRPTISRFEADLHTHLQTSLAVQYGIQLGKPVYIVNAEVDEERLVETVAAKSRLSNDS